MIPLEVLRYLGYKIDVDKETGTASIRGFGIATMFDPKDQKTITGLIGNHIIRKNQFLENEGLASFE